MLDILPESRGDISVRNASGKLTGHDYKDVLIPCFETIIGEQCALSHGLCFSWAAKLEALFMKTELSIFSSDHLQEDWDWIAF